jgi:Glycosyl transferase family 11
VNKVITRIKGGLGNQLFCYAAARRLALVNDVELVIDDISGFARDIGYQQQYALDHFCIPVRKATPSERMEPFERYRRGMIKWLSRKKPFSERLYLEQEGNDFTEGLLTLKISKILYLDGYWQSEKYFKDVEKVIREDLQITPPPDLENQQMAAKINSCNAVALHVRWFDDPEIIVTTPRNLPADYYQTAIALIEQKVDSPHYFIFSDNPEATSKKIALPENRVTFITHNRGDKNAYADLWLISQCQHFILANSTFSWWGAWLGDKEGSIIVSSKLKLAWWNFDSQLPDSWIKI